MSLYSNINDVRLEFKSLPDTGKVVITDTKILEYLLQANTIINSVIGIRYVTPVTGLLPVKQNDSIAITAVDSTDYILSISSYGSVRSYTFNSGLGSTIASISNGLIALIEADNNSIISSEIDGITGIKTTANVSGLSYDISTNGNMVVTNNSVAVSGSESLRLLSLIEAGLASCKIADILRVKVAKELESSKVSQDIKDGSCSSKYMAILNKIKNNQITLDDATLITSGGGLNSFILESGYQPFYDIEKKQW